MNKGDISGASDTPNAGAASRQNADSPEFLSSTPVSPNIKKGVEVAPKKADLAAAMEAELAAADSDASEKTDKKDGEKSKSFIAEQEKPVETIVASGEDYANAFGLAYDNEIKAVKVGSATAHADAAKKEATGLTGRSRYGAVKKTKTKAEKLAEKEAAEAAKAAAKAAEEAAEKARAEQAKRQAESAKTAEKIASKEKLPSFFKKAMNEDVVVIKHDRVPPPRGRYRRIALIAVVFLIIVGGIWLMMKKGNEENLFEKPNNTGGKEPISVEEIDALLNVDEYENMRMLERRILRTARKKNMTTTGFDSSELTELFDNGISEYEEYYNQLTSHDLTISTKHGIYWPVILDDMKSQIESFKSLRQARSDILDALGGNSEAKAKVEQAGEKDLKVLEVYGRADSNHEEKDSEDMKKAVSELYTKYIDIDKFNDGKSAILQSQSALMEVRDEKEK